MIVFTLTMPNVGSWNGRWSGQDNKYVRLRDDKDVRPEFRNKDYLYNWGDGWCACVNVSDHINSKEAHNIEKGTHGFYGYDWMINSICKYGEIIPPSRQT